MALLLAVAVAAALCSPDARPQAPALLPPATALVPVESFFGRAEMTSPSLSPSGQHLAFLRTLPSGRNALFTLDLHNPQKPVGLAAFSDADVFGVRWVGDEFLVYSVTDSEAGSGTPDFAPGLFSVARSGGETRALVKTRREFVIDGNFARTDRRLETNHRLLQVPQDNSGEVIVGRVERGAGELITVEPIRLHVHTQRTRHLELGGAPSGVNRWLFDGQGEARVAVVAAHGRVQVHWRAPNSTEWKRILDADRLQMPWHPEAVDAAGGLYVVHAHGDEGTDVLSRFDFERGRPAEPPLVSVPGFDFRGSLVGERAGGRTLGVRALTDGEVTVWSDAAMKALQERIDGLLPGRANRLSCRNCGSDGRTVLVESWADRDPGTFFLWQGDKQQLSRLGRTRPAINPAQMVELSLHSIKARDGRRLPVWLTLPAFASATATATTTSTEPAPGTAGSPPPVVVLVHGGPMVRGVTWGWHALPQFLASRGYAVVEPEFRGSAGYGQAHLRAGWKQWGQAMQDDVADALAWAAAQGHVDGRRACIAGASYGGYAALMGLVRHADLYRCGIATVAVTDLMRFVEGSWWWRDDITDEGRRYDLPAMVGDLKTDADMLRLHSPVLQAARIRAPVLLVHGRRDQRVPPVHALDMRKALQAAGNEPEWLLFDDEGHGFARVENQQAYARRIEAFLARHLKNAPASR